MEGKSIGLSKYEALLEPQIIPLFFLCFRISFGPTRTRNLEKVSSLNSPNSDVGPVEHAHAFTTRVFYCLC